MHTPLVKHLSRVVFRGLSGINLPDSFEVCEEGGGRGGVDFAFLSASTDRLVATSYIGGGKMPVLFRFEVGDIDRGASISFLSQVCVCVCAWLDGVMFPVICVARFDVVDGANSLFGSCCEGC